MRPSPPPRSSEVPTLITRIAAVSPIHPKETERFIKFAIVGAIGAIVDFTILNLLVFGFGVHDLVANAISFTCAVLSNFTWNRLWTYPESRQFRKRQQLPQFVLVSIIGLGINTAVLYFVDRFLLSMGLSQALALNIGKAFAILVVLFWNFGANRFWTYRHVDRS